MFLLNPYIYVTELSKLQSELKKINDNQGYILIFVHSGIQILMGAAAFAILLFVSKREFELREYPQDDSKEEYSRSFKMKSERVFSGDHENYNFSPD